MEVDENKINSGGYGYCWTRDAVFITKALNLLGMTEITEKFYNTFCKNTQSKNGMWEQRFFSNCKLAPCWGYQIDETASVIYGIYSHYKYTKNEKFLTNNLKMCEKGIEFLIKYIKNLIGIEETDIVKKELLEKYENKDNMYKKVSYDIWEMNEGVHLYSLASIFSAFDSMINIYNIVKENYKNNRVKLEKIEKQKNQLDKYKSEIKIFIKNNLYNDKQKILLRNMLDERMDISVLGAVTPFEIFDANEKIVKNTVEKINMTLRTYSGGYLRFENDSYMGGKNPWPIATLWMALYYIKIGDLENACKCINFVANTSSKYGFLSEQIDNTILKPNWVIGLGWSHAMFIIALMNLEEKL